MEVLVGVILAQLLKATSGEKMARPGSHGFVASRKLYRFVGPTHSEVLAPVERPRDVDEKTGGLRSGGQKNQVRSPNQEVLGHGART